MSTQVNTELMERAAEMLDYWTGTMYAKLIEQALDDDLDSLAFHVKRAEQQVAIEEMYSDEMTPERAEQMYTEAEAKRDELREDGYPDVY